MSQVLQWLLGLERIAFDGESRLDLVFATPPARWIMLIGAILAAVAVGYLYRREVLALRWRLVLMLLRFGLIMTILLLFSRPMLVLRRRHVEPSTVTVLLDRSASMAEVDVEGPVGDPAPQREKALSRWQAAIRAFSHPERGLMPPMLARHRAEVWLFDESIERVGSLNSAQSLVAMTEQLESVTPRGAGTQIAGSLESVLERMHGPEMVVRRNRLHETIVISISRSKRVDE